MLLLFLAATACTAVLASPVFPHVRHDASTTEGGFHVPLYRREVTSRGRKRAVGTGAAGLGDVLDITYNVLIQVGETVTPVVLDTGSSDLWVLSNACATDCFTTDVPLYPQTTFQPTGLAVQLSYGDSLTGTHANGPIGKDTAAIANFSLDSQYFAAISTTNTSVLATGSAGIFGLGFPINSIIWNQLLKAQYPHARRNVIPTVSTPSSSSSNLATRIFPDLSFVAHHNASYRLQVVSDGSPSVWDVLGTFGTQGPLIPRLISAGLLASPMVTITLQRDTIDIGGNQGTLSIGELPPGVRMENLTWVPLRGYTVDQGGLPAPPDSPSEVYPLTWEIPIDNVFFDGQLLPRSTLNASNITLSALVDTGNSLIRGPQDVMQGISNILGGGTYPCAEPHSLAFQIGGVVFSVDPRDFGSQTFTNSDYLCTPNLASTDPPGSGFQYSWSLGDPFLKSVLASFYYGNLTYPSHDQPRIGLMSTVPSDASAQLQEVVNYANTSLHGNLPAMSEPAPSSTLLAANTNIDGVPQARESGLAPIASKSSGAGSARTSVYSSLAVAMMCMLWSVIVTYA